MNGPLYLMCHVKQHDCMHIRLETGMGHLVTVCLVSGSHLFYRISLTDTDSAFDHVG